MNQQMLQRLIERQEEIYQGLVLANWLALVGRISEVVFAVLFIILLMRTGEILRRLGGRRAAVEETRDRSPTQGGGIG